MMHAQARGSADQAINLATPPAPSMAAPLNGLNSCRQCTVSSAWCSIAKVQAQLGPRNGMHSMQGMADAWPDLRDAAQAPRSITARGSSLQISSQSLTKPSGFTLLPPRQLTGSSSGMSCPCLANSAAQNMDTIFLRRHLALR